MITERPTLARLRALGIPLDADGYILSEEQASALIDLMVGYAGWMWANWWGQEPHRDSAEEWLNDNTAEGRAAFPEQDAYVVRRD